MLNICIVQLKSDTTQKILNPGTFWSISGLLRMSVFLNESIFELLVGRDKCLSKALGKCDFPFYGLNK